MSVATLGLTTLRRTMDATRLTQIANAPSVRPFLGGAPGKLNLQAVADNPSNILLESEHGGFVLTCLDQGFYEVHSLFLPEGRGEESHAAMRAGLLYMFTRTDCYELVTKLPETNPAAFSLAKAAGFTARFSRAHCWPTDGGVTYAGLMVHEWIQRSDECLTAGEDFHDQLEIAKEDAGSPLPVHDKDDAHDRAAGACALMCRAGQAPKGVMLYNRWAKFAGYQPIALLSAAPATIDLRDAVVSLSCDDRMEVLLCR